VSCRAARSGSLKRRYNHTRECSLQVVAMMLLEKIRFQEEEGVAAVLQQRKEESRRGQLLKLV
jgi:hypothetical protein